MSMSKIIYGKRGCGVSDMATTLAKDALCVSGKHNDGCTCRSCQLSLSSHPDYAVFDKTSYFVEDVEEMLSFASKMPVIAPSKVIVVHNMGSITPESQNKLLKNLESNRDLCMIGTVYEGSDVLPTIKSRTQSVTVQPFSYRQFAGAVQNDTDFLFTMTGGCPGLVDEMRELIPTFEDILHSIETQDVQLIFNTLHLVTEKDSTSFYEAHKIFIPNLFSFMEQIILNYLHMEFIGSCYGLAISPGSGLSSRYYELLPILEEERIRSFSSNYTKYEFLLGLSRICEQLIQIYECLNRAN